MPQLSIDKGHPHVTNVRMRRTSLDQAAEWLTELTEMFSFEGVTPVIRPQASATSVALLDAQDLSAASGYFGRRLLS